MEFRLTGRLIGDKMRDRTTYVLAAIVGTLINLYGQLLVPWFRSSANPFETFADQLRDSPGLTIFSIFLGYAFPFCVGLYSGVAARYSRGSDRGSLPARIPNARASVRRQIRIAGWSAIRTPSRSATGTPSAGWRSTRATWRNTAGRTPRGWLVTTGGAKSGVKWRHRPAPIYKTRYLRNPLSQKHLRPI